MSRVSSIRQPGAVEASASRPRPDISCKENPNKLSSAGAFGCTFVIAPSWSLRLSAEDALLLVPMLHTSGFAMCVRSELQLRRIDAEWMYHVVPTICGDASRVLFEDNAGGASSISEAMSMELLARSFGARLTHTELELLYFPANSAMTDFCVELEGVHVGVSVTRAMQSTNPLAPTFGIAEATSLLQKKLAGVLASTSTCFNVDWKKQLLHIWAESASVEEAIHQAYEGLPPELTADTVCLVTLCTVPELYNEKRSVAEGRPCVQRPLKGAKDDRHLRVLRESEPKSCVSLPPRASSCFSH